MQPSRWTLYEMMPIDAHHAFSDEDTVGKILDDTPQPHFRGDERAEFARGLRGGHRAAR